MPGASVGPASAAPVAAASGQQPRPARSSRLGLFKRSSTVGAARASSGSADSLQDLNPTAMSRRDERDMLRAGRKLANQAQQQQLGPGQHRSSQLLLTAQNQHLSQQPAAEPAGQPMHFPSMQLDYGGGPGGGGGQQQQPQPAPSQCMQQQQQQLLHPSLQQQAHQNQHHQLLLQQQHQQQQQHNQNTIYYKSHTTDSGSLALSSEQCNDQEHEDRPSCMQIMKRLFFSLVLGTIVAICWVMIIHTLKWIAIKGNELELLTHQQQQQLLLQRHHHRSSAALQAGAGEPTDVGASDGRFELDRAVSLLGRPPPSAATAPTIDESDADSHIVRPLADTPTSSAQSEPSAYPESRATQPLIVERDRPSDAPLSGREPRKEPKRRSDDTGDTSSGGAAARPRRWAGGGGDAAPAADDDDDDDSADQPAANGQQQRAAKPELASAGSRLKHGQNKQLPRNTESSATNRISPLDHQQNKRRIVPAPHRQRSPAAAPAPPNNDPSDPLAAQNYAAGSAHERPPLAATATAAAAATPPLVIPDFGANYNEELKSSSDLADLAGVEAPASAAAAAAQEPPSITGQWPSPPAAVDRTVSGALEAREAPIAGGLFYRAPFFTSWFVSTWNILFMPVFTLISSCCFRNEDSTTKKLLVESISQFMDNGLTTLQFLGRCAFFSVLWIGTIFGIVYSLSNIDATVVMALFACSAALVYLLSWVLLHQQFVGVRIVAVIICTTGIALLAYMDNSRTLGSVLIVAGSALCSAVYKVIYQRMFGFWSIAQMSLFFTLIGLFNALFMWPVALLLYFFRVELIAWRYIPWMHLTAAGALHLTANIIAYFGPICSYDIFLTMGLMLAVVLSAVIDVTFYKITFFGMKLAGVLLLMIGFLVCLLPENWNEFLYDLVNERFVRWKKQRNLKKSRNKVQDLSTGQMSRLRTPSGRVK